MTLTKELQGLQAAQAALASDFADRVAYDAVQRGQEWARQDAPRDTTALVQSVSVQSNFLNDYDINVTMAQELNPRGEFYFEPDYDHVPGHAVLLVGAGYGRIVNEGSTTGPAQPFWDRTVFSVEAMLGSIAEQEWRNALKAV